MNITEGSPSLDVGHLIVELNKAPFVDLLINGRNFLSSTLRKVIGSTYHPMLVDLFSLDKIGSFPGLRERAKKTFYMS